MATQTPIERTSLTLTLEERYATQKVGGAFDVKSTIQKSGHMSLTLSGNSSFKSAQTTPSGFKVNQPVMVTEYKDSALNVVDSMGFSNKKYKP